jgi:hypothetical protein
VIELEGTKLVKTSEKDNEGAMVVTTESVVSSASVPWVDVVCSTTVLWMVDSSDKLLTKVFGSSINVEV